LLRGLPWTIDLWQSQNIYLDIQDQTTVAMTAGAVQGDRETKIWLELFRQLGTLLAIRVPPLPAATGRIPTK
jgi:hypothetical protein